MTNTSDLERSYKRYALYELEHTPKTLKQTISIVDRLVSFVGSGDLQGMDTRAVRDFLHTQRETKAWSAKTFRIYRQCLKTYFQWVVDEEWMKQNPIDKIKQPPLPVRLPRCLSKEQTIQLLAHIHNYPWRMELQVSRNEALFAIIIYGGLRLSEVTNLKVLDVDFTAGWICVIQGKNRKDRNVPINDELRRILQRYRKAQQKLGTPSIWFFPSVKSESQLTKKNVQDIFSTISKASGIKVTPHMLRHTFGRLCVEAGINLMTIKSYMGHADIRTTQIYTFVSSEQGKKEIHQLSLYSTI